MTRAARAHYCHEHPIGSTSVSGGSITAGVMALNWTKLGAGSAFEPTVVRPFRDVAGTTIDVKSILAVARFPYPAGI